MKYLIPILLAAVTFANAGTLDSRSSGAAGFENVGPLVENWYRYSTSTVGNDGSVVFHQKSSSNAPYKVIKTAADSSTTGYAVGPFKVFESLSFSNRSGEINVFSVEAAGSAGVADRNGPEQQVGYFTPGGSINYVPLGSYGIEQVRDLYLNGNDKNLYLSFAGSKVGSNNSDLFYLKFDYNDGVWQIGAGGLTKVDFGVVKGTRTLPRITADGTFVYYRLDSRVFRYDTAAETHTLVKSGVGRYDISADGGVIYYVSGEDLYKAPLVNGVGQVDTNSVQMIDNLIKPGFYDAADFDFGKNIRSSADGRYLVFISDKLHADATSVLGSSIAYLLDSYTGDIVCLSKDSDSTTFNSVNVSISPNGKFACFAARPDFLSSDYAVYRYALSANQLNVRRLFADLDISADHKSMTTENGNKILTVLKDGSRYDPSLIDVLTGKVHQLKAGSATPTFQYKISSSGSAFLEDNGLSFVWQPLDSAFVLGSEKEIVNADINFFGMDRSGNNVFFLQNRNLWKWSADVSSSTLLSAAVADIDDNPLTSSLAVSANGNFAVCKKVGGGLAAFSKDSAGSWRSHEPSSLSAVTKFLNASVSRNGRILTFYNGADVKVFDFFKDSFTSNAALVGSGTSFVSASGAEVTFVSSGILKSLRLSDNLVRDIETASGTYDFADIIPNGGSVTFAADADALEGRDGELDLYQYYFERDNSAPSGISSSAQLKVDTLRLLDVNVVASDDYDMDLEVKSVTPPANGSFNYQQLFDGRASYQSDRGFIGFDSLSLKAVDSSGLENDVAVNIEVLKSTLNFADGYIPDNPAVDGYDVALSLTSAGLNSNLELRSAGAVVTFADPAFSDLRLSGDGSQIIVENVTALGYEDVNFQIDGVSRTVRLEYGRDFMVRTGWNMLGVPYEFTEAGFTALEQGLEAGWFWNGDNYTSCIDELSGRLKNIEKGSAYWLFHMAGGDSEAIALAPNRPAASVSDLNSSEDDDFFKIPVFDNKWRMISPAGYDEAAARRVSGVPVWGWDSENSVYDLPENNGGWEMHSLEGYWQFGHDGFDNVDSKGKVELKYDQSAK